MKSGKIDTGRKRKINCVGCVMERWNRGSMYGKDAENGWRKEKVGRR